MLVSVIIPTKNRGHIIKETLDSILCQSYVNWECIIVDDRSSDNTVSVVSDYMKTDARFQFFARPKYKIKGANSCRNIGFEKAKGEFINWFDSDDIMHPDFLKLKLEALVNNPSLDFCACVSSTFKTDYKLSEAINRPFVMHSINYVEDYLINGLYFYTPSPLWSYEFLKDKVLFDETLHRSQESDFHFRMLTHQPKYTYLNRVLFYIRTGIISISNEAPNSIIAQKSIFKYFDNVFNYLKNAQELKNRQKLLAYVFYRQATNYYNINQLCKGFGERFNIFKSHAKYIKGYVSASDKLNKHIVKIYFGLFVLLFFNKGYKYFYFPQYDYTKKYD